jgi:hypothetical protein
MAMEIIDLSGSTPSSVYTERGFPVSELILHDTSGGGDFNNKSEAELQALLNATIHWFQGGGGLSIHYLIGPEKLGGKIYRLCKEQFAAFHAVGDKGLSTINGFTCSKDNRIAIGIERFGQPGDVVGPNQRAAFLWLVVDICKRNGLSASQVISHASIQSDRTDGRVLLAAARDAVTSSIAGGATVSPDYDPLMTYYSDHGGETAFGKPLGGQYGTNGSVERMFERAHLYLDKATDKVMVEPLLNLNGHVIAHGMLDYWNKVNVPGVQHPLGLPLSEEMDWTDPAGKKFVIQIFERGVLGYDGSIADPAYRVQGLIIGPEWAKSHLKAA